MIQCKPIDRNMILSHGDSVFLEEGKARALADLGKVTYDGYTPLARILREQPPTAERVPGAATPPCGLTDTRPPAPGSYLTRSTWAPHRAGACTPRVLWVQDRSKLGGAEMSNDTVVAVGEALGFDVISLCPGHFVEALIAEADIAILNNIHEFRGEQFYALLAMCHERRLPYVKYEHDYRELGRENISRALFQRARLAVFLSPRHAEKHAAALGPIENMIVLPLAVDTDFYTPGKDARADVLVPSPKKCGAELEACMVKNPEPTYTLVGPNSISAPKGVKVVGVPAQSAEGMRSLYRKASLVVHLPEKEWAGERVVLEALLCGARVSTNERVGHASWPVLPDRAALRSAPYRFWEAVSKCI